jgi:nucleoside-diphosphate kinase
MNPEFPTYGFRLQYFDERAELIRPYILTFRTEIGEIEVLDLKNRRPFLKRTVVHNLALHDLYPGNKFMLNGRQYEVLDYADEFTRSAFADAIQHTYAMLKPGFSQHLGDALDRIYSEGLGVVQLRFGSVTRQTASRFYAEHEGKPFYEELVKYITSGPIVALELMGPNAIAKWRQIIGPTNLDVAKRDAPNSLRAQFARSTTENFAHGSDAPESAAREIGIIFGGLAVKLASSLTGTALCIVKPHAVRAGFAGRIIQQIADGGFIIIGAGLFTLDMAQATEFYEVYRGVVDEFVELSTELSSGPCIALEVTREGGDVVKSLRELCGPRDIPVAKAIAPESVRAIFGTNIVQNAVHCTDLESEAQLECEYFFCLLEAA